MIVAFDLLWRNHFICNQVIGQIEQPTDKHLVAGDHLLLHFFPCAVR